VIRLALPVLHGYDPGVPGQARGGPFHDSPAPRGMMSSGPDEVRAALAAHLTRLWRYGLVLSRRRDLAEDLVQATCLRALERADQYRAGTRIDRWLFSILHSIWLNDVRALRVRLGEGQVDSEATLSFDGAAQIETGVLAAQVLREVAALPEGQREAVFLVYGEGWAYREAAAILDVPIGTVMSRLAAARATLAKHMQADASLGGRPEVDQP
jgi:RNA polymerase sigma-70 factor (ECF subfamily)